MKRKLFLDTETFSRVDLKVVGATNYFAHPSTIVRLCAYVVDNQPMVPVLEREEMGDGLLELLQDPNYLKIAWNSSFDHAALQSHYKTKLDYHQWFDAMALAGACSLPLSLGQCGDALGLVEDDRKMRDGTRLIRLFSMPNAKGKMNDMNSHFDDWVKWKQYAGQDVATMRVIYNRLRKYEKYVMPSTERQVWRVSEHINRVGVPVDLDLCRDVITLNDAHRKQRQQRGRAITKLDNPASVQQLAAWFKYHGIDLPDMRAGTLREAIASKKLIGQFAEAAQIRLDLSRSSVAKFQQILNRACAHTGRLYDTMQYYGAHTGRWAGRGAQLHNLPRGILKGDTAEEMVAEVDHIIGMVQRGEIENIEFLYSSVSEVLSSLVRPTVLAPPGQLLVVADYSSIETAVIAWLAGCTELLEVFEQGRDPYRNFAAVLLDTKEDAVTKGERNYAKPAMLGAVFGLSAGGYINYARQFGQEVDQTEAQKIIDTFRKTYPEIPKFWHSLREAAFDAMIDQPGSEPQEAGKHIQFHRVDKHHLFAKLPSGRDLMYPFAKVETGHGGWEQLTYYTLKDHAWVKTATHPGKLAENMTQAVARDLLAHGLSQAVFDGFEIPLHIHDEIVALVPENDDYHTLNRLIEVMTERPDWGADIPVSADGFTTTRYLKL